MRTSSGHSCARVSSRSAACGKVGAFPVGSSTRCSPNGEEGVRLTMSFILRG